MCEWFQGKTRVSVVQSWPYQALVHQKQVLYLAKVGAAIFFDLHPYIVAIRTMLYHNNMIGIHHTDSSKYPVRQFVSRDTAGIMNCFWLLATFQIFTYFIMYILASMNMKVQNYWAVSTGTYSIAIWWSLLSTLPTNQQLHQSHDEGWRIKNWWQLLESQLSIMQLSNVYNSQPVVGEGYSQSGHHGWEEISTELHQAHNLSTQWRWSLVP